MSQLSDIQAFINLSRNAKKPSDLEALLHAVTRDMGFDHFALIHHVDLTPFDKDLNHMESGQLLMLTDYPETWIDDYINDDIVTYDPVLLASHRTSVGFTWSEIPTIIDLKTPHVQQLKRGQNVGIGDGFTVPSNVPGEANGSCNFVVKTGRELPTGQLLMAQLVGNYAFEAGRNIITQAVVPRHRLKPVRLSPRQLECVTLMAKGKTDWEIATILGLKYDTAREYMKDAMRRYDVVSRVQVVVRAVHDGQIPLSEILR
jgi:LuxR family transcriptional regulator, quorum-sensing system regulator CciR